MRTILVTVALAAVPLLVFVVFGEVRGSKIEASDFGAGSQLIGSLPQGFFWVWTYAVSPIGNVNHAAALGIVPTYLPLNITTSLLPTVLRVMFGVPGYPIPLVTPAFNATSAYAPLIADFGFAGAAAWMATFQLICSYVYVRAKQGSVVHLVLYPPLFVSLVLSIFYLYAMNFAVVLYPWLCLALRNYVARRKANEDLAHTISDPALMPAREIGK